MNRALLLLQRTLRIDDHPALSEIIAQGLLPIPVYIHTDDGIGAAARWWLHHSLSRLQRELTQLGGGLLLDRGPLLSTLNRLIDRTEAVAVYTSAPLSAELRDIERQLKAPLRVCGGNLLLGANEVVKGDGSPYRVFTPFYRAARRIAPLPPVIPPSKLPSPPPLQGVTLDDLGLYPQPDWSTGIRSSWQPGERAAHAQLQRFTDAPLASYSDARERPAIEGTSRLSPHFAFGELSPRQALVSIEGAAASEDEKEAWRRQLYWREFAWYLLHHFPQTVDRPFNPKFTDWSWRDDPAALKAWQRGETGIPLVDAGMRELWHTGWMHNRVRMVVASFLTKNLLIHWRHGADWFMDTLVDADIANNTLGWQWVAGCGADAAPYFRIFNPVTQGKKFDPQGDYIRRWLPELAGLPNRWIHEPWNAPSKELAMAGIELERDYPAPIVDLAATRQRALALYQEFKHR